MVMELLDGQSLKDRLERGPLAARRSPRAWRADRRCARCRSRARRRPSRHQARQSVCYEARHDQVLDFGVAKLGEAGRSADGVAATMGGSDQLTTIGTTIGTVAYMSPEQARGRRSIRGAICSPPGSCSTRWPPASCVPGCDSRNDLREPADEGADGAVGNQGGHSRRARSRHLEGARERSRHAISRRGRLRADLKRLKRAADSERDCGGRMVGRRRGCEGAALVNRGTKRESGSAKEITWRKPVFIGAPLVTALAVAGFFSIDRSTHPR